MIRVECVAAALLMPALPLIAGNEAPAASGNGKEYQVSACVQVDATVNFAAVSIGKIVASDLFQRIGVQLRWQCFEDEPPAQDFSKEILIRFVDSSRREIVHRDALAYARPYAIEGVRVVIFYDRLGPRIANGSLEAGSIMGYVFAHEIAHVLRGVDSHEPEGLMRARWTPQDFHAMEERRMRFTREEGETMRENLEMRFARRLHSEARLASVSAKTSEPRAIASGDANSSGR